MLVSAASLSVILTCAFVIADAHIVYASRTFCDLTGHSEGKVLGQDCHLLRSSGRRIVRNGVRWSTSAEVVRDICFALDKYHGVQVGLISYRKCGHPFINSAPTPAENSVSEIAFHVEFQVNVNDQPV